MKKVLLATTALVAFAGAATADVNLSGSARFGLNYSDNAFADPSTTLERRITLNIDMSTETDSGLELGARIRLRDNEGLGIAATNGGVVYLKSGGFKLSTGNICGALECMPGTYAGSLGLNGAGYHNVSINTVDQGYWTWIAYTSSGGGWNGVEIEYSAGDFSSMLSYGLVNAPSFVANPMSAHLAYNFGDWTVALGMQDGDGAVWFDKTILTIGGKLGDFGVGLAYADNNGTDKITLNGSYTTGATTVSVFVADDGSVAATDTLWGLGAAYDMGGASFVAGYSHNAIGDGYASAGIKFKF